MLGDITGRIRADWARTVGTTGAAIRIHNRQRSETVAGLIRLENLGGLVVKFTRQIYMPTQADEVGRRRTIVNLSFDEPGRLTGTDYLVTSAIVRSGEDDPLIADLRKAANVIGRPAWLIPVSAIVDIDQIAASRL